MDRPPVAQLNIVTLLMLAGVFGICMFGVSILGKAANTGMDIARSEAAAPIPTVDREAHAIDTVQNVAEVGFASNVAIAGQGFSAVKSVAWSNAFTIIAIMGIIIAVAYLVGKVKGGSRVSERDFEHERNRLP